MNRPLATHLVGGTLGLLILLPSLSSGYQIHADAFGSVAGTSGNSGHSLGMTASLTPAGLATSSDHEEFVGFWFPMELDDTSDVVANNSILPTLTRLKPNCPNPFHSATQVRFQIAGELGKQVDTRLEIFLVSGRRISVLLDEPMAPGFHEVSWDATDRDGNSVSSGIYYARLTAGFYVKTIRLVLTK